MANATTIIGDPIVADAPLDPSLCRITGRLLDIHGHPLAGYSLTVRHKYIPVGIGTQSMILREQQSVRSDKDGYLSFDLFRDSKAEVEIPNLLSTTFFCINVPDQANADLIDVVFPYVVSAAWITDDPYAAQIGERVIIRVEVTLSDGQVLPLSTFVSSSDNEAVASPVGMGAYKALAVGTALITLESIDEASLNLNLESNGTPLVFQDIPSPTLPAPLTINVT